jgi:diadenosine tetraphosphate (Ap4A) HIT family hydrolase
MHTHIHFIPKTSEEDGLKMKWITKTIDNAELGEVAKKVRAVLNQGN